MLRTENLTKIYGSHRAVNAVDIHVKKGDIYGFIGKNGAGKSTLMKMVAGLVAPSKGRIELFGSSDIEKQRIRIYEHLEDTTEINHRLLLAGIEIKESYLAGQDLEGYFMERIGS